MNKTNLIIIIALLVVLLAFLLFLLFKIKKQKEKKSLHVVKREKDLFDILKILKDKKSSQEELEEHINLLVDKFYKIDNFDDYEKAIIYLCIHPNTNKKLIIRLDSTLEKNNPQYSKDIARALKVGLDSH